MRLITMLIDLLERITSWKSTLAGLMLLAFGMLITWYIGLGAFRLDTALVTGIFALGGTLVLSKDPRPRRK
ncbi:MAG: hypothetical protein ACK5P1_10075 [Sphingobacteriia bacterium]|jgi:hypothetical protein